MDIEGENLEKTKEIETMQSISSYINPNTRGLTSNYKNTAIKDKETYNEAMSQHLLNPVEDLVQVLKTPIKLAKSSSLSRQNNSVNIAEGQRIRVNGGHVLTVTAHEVYETTGYDARNATYKNGTFIAEDGTDLLALFKEKSKNGAGYELYSKRWLQYAKNGWKKENDLVLKIGFDSSGLYDIGQEKGYGATQNMWMKGVSQSMFEARV